MQGKATVGIFVLGVAGFAANVRAVSHPLVPIGPTNSTGNGLGAVLTTLTIQRIRTEEGCVAWNGFADIIRSPACPSGSGLTGGDEKTGFSQTQTRPISLLRTTDAANFVVVFNADEFDDEIRLDNLQLTVFDQSGVPRYVSAPFLTATTFGFGGIGTAGFLYKLDPADAAALNADHVFSNPTWRIGLAARVSDSGGGPETFSLSRPCPDVALTPSSLPAATQNAAYGPVNGTATGGVTPYTSIEASPAPPYLGGITFTSDMAAGTFQFSGTPTASGNMNVTVTATDANGCADEVVYSLVVNAASCPTILVTPASIADGTAGQFYGPVQFSATGGTGPYTFSDDGSLSGTGLTLSVGGRLSGTPIVTGAVEFAVTATDAAGVPAGCQGGQAIVLFINPPVCPVIMLAPPSLPAATQNAAYGPVNGTATGGVTPYTGIAANPPPPYLGGITFTSDTTAGTFHFSGTPTASGSVNVTVTATDANLCADQVVYSLVVNAASCPTITVAPSTLADGTAGQFYGPAQFSASGGTGPYTFSDNGSLSGTGLTLSATGILSGTPTVSGTVGFAVTATDTAGVPAGCEGGQAVALFINPPVCPDLVLEPSSLPAATQNVAYGPVHGTVTGGAAPYIRIDASPSHPYLGGITFTSDTAAGTFQFSGTPTVAGSINVTVTATDANQCTDEAVYSLVVNAASCPTITVAPSTLADGIGDQPYGPVQFSASGGTGPYTFSDNGSLSGTGLTLSVGGILSGTPIVIGTVDFAVTATDTAGNPAGCQGGQAVELLVHRPPEEIAPIGAVPTLGAAGLGLLSLALAGAALFLIRRV
jgi:hypothetical protein